MGEENGYATVLDFEHRSSMIDDTNPTSARVMRALAIVWGMGIVMIGVLPFSNFVGHSHWEYVKWFPSYDNLRSWRYIFDMTANTILFIPYGYFLARSIGAPPARSTRIAVGSAALMSSGIEFYQVYCHNRHPSPLDIFANTLGSLIGATVAALIDRTRRTPPADRITPTPAARTPAQ
jgi:glycopeptide antibiotics resistance protein